MNLPTAIFLALLTVALLVNAALFYAQCIESFFRFQEKLMMRDHMGCLYSAGLIVACGIFGDLTGKTGAILLVLAWTQ